jgi:prepilin-type N-terminal cleavage/methylation domain-containing protein/prepilin-type processing-associated H-X9-DG protein
MRATRWGNRLKAFTLLELICVIAVIGILAALLLPAVNRGRSRAKIIGCIGNLRQVGLAFQAFAHDHSSQFPMAVPANAGGSEEFTTSSYQLAGGFYFSFRHFQSLSNDLGSAKLLACPADTRLPAETFGLLNNKHLSYFVGLRAEYGKPYSILAGDRNLTNDFEKLPTLLRPQVNRGWRWTAELHQFKGNLLFSDGHVEDKTSEKLAARLSQLPYLGEFALPNVPGTGISVTTAGAATRTIPSGAAPSLAGGPLPVASGPTSPAPSRGPGPAVSSSLNSTPALRSAWSSGGPTPEAGTNARPANPTPQTTPGPPEKPGAAEDPGFSFFPVWLGTATLELMRSMAWLLYLLLLLVATAAVVIRLRSRSPRSKRKIVVWDIENRN